jgi:hypothetical protein
MKAPILENNQYSVLLAAFDTGIVLTTDFKRYDGNGEVFHVFKTYALAKEFIAKKLNENDNYEFNIYDSQGKYLSTIDKNGNR